MGGKYLAGLVYLADGKLVAATTAQPEMTASRQWLWVVVCGLSMGLRGMSPRTPSRRAVGESKLLDSSHK